MNEGLREPPVPGPAERRERLLMAALDAGDGPAEALARAREMESFIVNGLDGQLRLSPPRETPEPPRPVAPPPGPPDKAQAQDDGPDKRKRPGTPAARRSGPKGWPPEKVARFKELWEAGTSAEAIAKELGTSKGAVYTRANAMGLGRRRIRQGLILITPVAPAAKDDKAPPEPQREKQRGKGRPKRWATELSKEFLDMWEGPSSLAKIAKHFRLSENSLYTLARRLGAGSRGSQEGAPVKARLPSEALPDTSELRPLPAPDRTVPVVATVDAVVSYLQSRDIVVLPDENSVRVKRWLVEGRRDCGLTALELIDYANKERGRIGKPPFVYGMG